MVVAMDAAALMRRAGLDPPEPWQQNLLQSLADRLALLCARQTGKSTITAVVVLQFALYMAKAIILIISPSKDQSDRLFAKIVEIFDALPEQVDGARKLAGRLTLANGSQIISLPGNEKTIRGLSADLIVFDEAAQVSDELFNTAMPMVIARGGRVIALSTPFGQRGFFYRACTQSDGRWHVIKVTAEQSARIRSEDLEKARRESDAHSFRQEFMCEFQGDATLFFPLELVDAAFAQNVEPLVERLSTNPFEEMLRNVRQAQRPAPSRSTKTS
jgi:Terminase large subunit, T4likevirus-type, N-terminal